MSASSALPQASQAADPRRPLDKSQILLQNNVSQEMLAIFAKVGDYQRWQRNKPKTQPGSKRSRSKSKSKSKSSRKRQRRRRRRHSQSSEEPEYEIEGDAQSSEESSAQEIESDAGPSVSTSPSDVECLEVEDDNVEGDQLDELDEKSDEKLDGEMNGESDDGLDEGLDDELDSEMEAALDKIKDVVFEPAPQIFPKTANNGDTRQEMRVWATLSEAKRAEAFRTR